MNNSVLKTLQFSLSSGVKTSFEYIWPDVLCLLEIWIVFCPFFSNIPYFCHPFHYPFFPLKWLVFNWYISVIPYYLVKYFFSYGGLYCLYLWPVFLNILIKLWYVNYWILIIWKVIWKTTSMQQVLIYWNLPTSSLILTNNILDFIHFHGSHTVVCTNVPDFCNYT